LKTSDGPAFPRVVPMRPPPTHPCNMKMLSSLGLSALLLVSSVPIFAAEPQRFGINAAGAEFGTVAAGAVPGTMNTHYFYPSAADLDYFKANGLELIRLPFKWERIQRTLHGALHEPDMLEIDRVLNEIEKRGMRVILDLHNYGRRYDETTATTYAIGSPNLPLSAFKDVWQRLAARYKGRACIWAYGIMNEPHGQAPYTWLDSAQQAVDGIRLEDMQHAILIPGEGWSAAHRWLQVSTNLLNIVDPADNVIYEAHQYFDDDRSGEYNQSYDNEGAYPEVGVDLVSDFVEWCTTNGVRGFIGEYGVPRNDARWNVVLQNFVAYLQANGISGTYWAGGSRWDNSYKIDAHIRKPNHAEAPQMAVLTDYASGLGTQFWPTYEWFRNQAPGGYAYPYNSAGGTLTANFAATDDFFPGSGPRSIKLNYTLPAGEYAGIGIHTTSGAYLVPNFEREHVLRFRAKGTAGSSLRVTVGDTNTNGNWIDTDTLSPLNGTWQLYEVPLASFVNGSVTGTAPLERVKFDVFPRNGSTHEVRIDQIEVGAPPTSAPTVSVDTSTSGSSFVVNAAVTLVATAADADGAIDLVEFLANGERVGADDTAPYQLATSFAATGTYDVRAIAYDSLGAVTRSSAKMLTITEPYGSELVVNGGLELGDSSWASDTAHTVVSSPVHGGGASLQSVPGTYSTGRQIISGITAGSTYRIEGWVKTDASLSGWVRIFLKWTDSSDNIITQSTLGSTVAAGTDWTQRLAELPAPAGATKLHLFLWNEYRTGGYAYFDDLSVRQKL
jgi:endoglucanase